MNGSVSDGTIADALRTACVPLTGAAKDYDPLLELIGDARFVLLGEATHGTHEFYRQRAIITRRLIEEKRFAGVAVEGDWPDALRVNSYVRLVGPDGDAEESLRGFRRFPTWMWRNTDVVDFISWLREHNRTRPQDSFMAGFYGLDLYSLFSSADAVIRYLELLDPKAAQHAREHYACFEAYGPDAEEYALALQTGLAGSCEDDVIAVLVEMIHRAADAVKLFGASAAEEAFYAEQNARVVRGAERYYRTMFDAGVSSWNLRDRHMMETLQDLSVHLGRRTGSNKIVVWAHNSHVGDARATDMNRRKEINIGQLCREAFGSSAVLVGFTTHSGTVTAARNWHETAQMRSVLPSLSGSVESLFHAIDEPAFYLDLRSGAGAKQHLAGRMLERAIGVVYRPESELVSHYMEVRPALQFDALIHFDRTRAVEPLERLDIPSAGEVPETFPSGV
jgi:erythromycin esterase-like protein